jgi:broad specificity phosphatase PhoE
MEIVCVRHGRTAWNAERRFQGHADIPLDGEGLEQARALAAHLRGEPFDLAITSDLDRAAATAGLICAGRDIVLERDPELREMRFGVWEGLTWPEIVARTPDLDEAHEKAPRYYTPENGESFAALTARSVRAFERITGRLGPEGRALVVSHAGVMHALVGGIFGAESELTMGLKFLPASVMRLAGSPATGWRIAAVNETAAGRTVAG